MHFFHKVNFRVSIRSLVSPVIYIDFVVPPLHLQPIIVSDTGFGSFFLSSALV